MGCRTADLPALFLHRVRLWLEKREPKRKNVSSKSLDSYVREKQAFHFTGPIVTLLTFLGALLTIQGALRDGVTSWVPSYLSGTYHVGTSIAIFATTFLPFINMFGVYFANFIYHRLKKQHFSNHQTLSIFHPY